MEDTAAGDPGDDVHNQPVPGVGEDLQTAAHPSAAPAAGPAAGAGFAASAGPAGAAGLAAGAGPTAEAEAQPGSANPWPHLDSYMEYKSADFVKRTVLFKCRLCSVHAEKCHHLSTCLELDESQVTCQETALEVSLFL